MAKNLVNTSRNLKMIPDGPLAGFLHTDNPLGIPVGGGDPGDPGDPDPIVPGQWWTPYLSSSVLDPAPSGFTQVSLPDGARMIYLSDKGSDSNDGLHPDRPRRTEYEATRLIRQGHGDILCIERGSPTLWDFEHFSVRNNLRGGDLNKPTIITWYGTGSRPRVIPPTMDRSYHSNFWWIGIHFVNPYQEFGNPLFNGGATKRNLAIQGQGTCNVRVEDCKFTGVERVYQAQDGSFMENFVDHRNICDYVYINTSSTTLSARPSALYSQSIHGLTISQGVNDYCGWHPDVPGAGANQYNHGFYIGRGGGIYDPVLIEDNIVSRPSSHIAQLRNGGIARRNIGIYPAIGFALGYYNPGIPDGRVCRLEENLVLRMHTMYRNAGSCNNGVCTSAIWGLDYSAFNPNAIYESIGNVVAERAYDYIQHSSPPSAGAIFKTWYHPELNGNRNYPNDPNLVVTSNDRVWRLENSTQGDGQFVDPGRSLEGYFSMIADEPMTYDQSMNVLKSRGPYEWHSELTPMAIHQYIMAGYDPV